MDNIGPDTLKRIQTIIDRIEETGRRMGIPEEKATRCVEIEYAMRLAERIDAFRRDAERWHAEEEKRHSQKFDWKKFVQKSLSYASGILKSED